MAQIPDIFINARLKLFPTNDGGRINGIRNYYRPNHVFEYIDGQVLRTFIGEIQFDNPDIIEPGEETYVRVRFLHIQELQKYLTVGRKWWIHEAGKRIGEAIITKV